MVPENTISGNQFVVHIPEAADPRQFRQRLGELGEVSALPAHPELLVLRLAGKKQIDPRVGWDQVRSTLGDITVDPVFVDEEDTLKYPIGTIKVRFSEVPGDIELANWCQRHGLSMLSRDKYAPNQLSFAPLKSRHPFLPDLLAELHEEANFGVTAWPETLTQFQRG